MSLTINALAVDEIEARLNIIMTLWLTLYAHKYVASQQMEKSDENTVMDYIIILGYFGRLPLRTLARVSVTPRALYRRIWHVMDYVSSF